MSRYAKEIGLSFADYGCKDCKSVAGPSALRQTLDGLIENWDLKEGETLAAFKKRVTQALESADISEAELSQEKKKLLIKRVVFDAFTPRLQEAIREAVNQFSPDVMRVAECKAHEIGLEDLDQYDRACLIDLIDTEIDEKYDDETRELTKIFLAAEQHLLETLTEAPNGGREVTPQCVDEDIDDESDQQFRVDQRIGNLWTLYRQEKSSPSIDYFFNEILVDSTLRRGNCLKRLWEKMSQNPGDDYKAFKEKLKNVLNKLLTKVKLLPTYAAISAVEEWCEMKATWQARIVFIPKLKETIRSVAAQLSLGTATDREDHASLIAAVTQAAATSLNICFSDVEEPGRVAECRHMRFQTILEDEIRNIIEKIYTPRHHQKMEEVTLEMMYSSDFPSQKDERYKVLQMALQRLMEEEDWLYCDSYSHYTFNMPRDYLQMRDTEEAMSKAVRSPGFLEEGTEEQRLRSLVNVGWRVITDDDTATAPADINPAHGLFDAARKILRSRGFLEPLWLEYRELKLELRETNLDVRELGLKNREVELRIRELELKIWEPKHRSRELGA